MREADRSEHEAIRAVIAAAYREYTSVLPPVLFEEYLANLLDLDARAEDGTMLVVERAGAIVGTVTFFEDAAGEGLSWPSGWAGLRALAVDPAARGLGIGRMLMDACLDRARAAGATVLGLHTASFMAAAVPTRSESRAVTSVGTTLSWSSPASSRATFRSWSTISASRSDSVAMYVRNVRRSSSPNWTS